MILIISYKKSFWHIFTEKIISLKISVWLIYCIKLVRVALYRFFKQYFYILSCFLNFIQNRIVQKWISFKKYQYSDKIFKWRKTRREMCCSKLARSTVQLYKSRVNRHLLHLCKIARDRFLLFARNMQIPNACPIHLPFANLLTFIHLQYMTFRNCSK